MPRRQTLLQSIQNLEARKRHETEVLRRYWERLLYSNQEWRTQFPESTVPPSLGNYLPFPPLNDTPPIDLNFIVLQDDDETQETDVSFEARESIIPACQEQLQQKWMSGTDLADCPLARKYGYKSDGYSKLQENVKFSQVKNRAVQNEFCDADLHRKHNEQNFNEDTSYAQNSCKHVCQPRILKDSVNMMCSAHKIAVILPQFLHRPSSIVKQDSLVSRGSNTETKTTDKSVATKEIIFPRTYVKLFCRGTQKNNRSEGKTIGNSDEPRKMQACQSFDEKVHKPGILHRVDSNAKQEDHLQSDFTINTGKSQRKSKRTVNGIPRSTSKNVESFSVSEQINIDRIKELSASKDSRFCVPPANTHRKEHFDANRTSQGNHGLSSKRLKKFTCERINSSGASRNVIRTNDKNPRTQKRTPIPRSVVHTSSAPTAIYYTSTDPILDSNGFTIQLLRLAVLLYAPALMPALNSLIAKKNLQSSIPIPCFEGSNELLSQVFRILSSQQCVPNLPYVPFADWRTNQTSTLTAERDSQCSSGSLASQGNREVTENTAAGSTSRAEDWRTCLNAPTSPFLIKKGRSVMAKKRHLKATLGTIDRFLFAENSVLGNTQFLPRLSFYIRNNLGKEEKRERKVLPVSRARLDAPQNSSKNKKTKSAEPEENKGKK